MRFSGLSCIFLSLVMSSCGAPPVYSERSREPVSLDGAECTAVLYDVQYEGIAASGGGLAQNHGIQYKIACNGTQTVSCRLDQTLNACVLDFEQEARRRDNNNHSGYHPPTG